MSGAGSVPVHTAPGPTTASRWDPQPLAYQELQSERTEVPVSRLLEETALGRPGGEDSGTGRAGQLGAAAHTAGSSAGLAVPCRAVTPFPSSP